jgi:hypothetical protein
MILTFSQRAFFDCLIIQQRHPDESMRLAVQEFREILFQQLPAANQVSTMKTLSWTCVVYTMTSGVNALHGQTSLASQYRLQTFIHSMLGGHLSVTNPGEPLQTEGNRENVRPYCGMQTSSRIGA